MAETATKLPITKTETKPAAAPAPAHWAPFESLRREIDQVFENFGFGSWPFPLSRRLRDLDFARPQATAFGVAPAVDVAEKDGGYEISVELPGLDEKDVEVKLANGTLTIKGEKKEEKEERQKDYYVSERRYGSFVRSFGVPEGVDAARIEASFAKGVLTIRLPKSAEAKSNEKTIAIKAA